MSPGIGFRKWVQEKISFTDSSSTDAISQGNAQMCGPIELSTEFENLGFELGSKQEFS